MTALSPEQAEHFEKLLNEYERMREDAQDGLKTVVGELREKLGALVAKEDLAEELAGFRLFVKRRYIRENHPEKADKADAKTEIADAYEFQASQAQVYTTRAHGAGRAKLDSVGTADATPHDADGVIIEQPAPSDVTVMGVEESCGSTDGSAGKRQRSTLEARTPETPSGSDAGEALAPEAGIQSGPQDPLPLQVHTTVEGTPLAPADNVHAFPGVDTSTDESGIPAFLRRAQKAGA